MKEKERFGSMPLNLQFFAEGKEKEDDDELEKDEEGTEETGSDGDGKSGKEEKGSGSADDKPKAKTFTQEQVTRMMTKEKNQGRNAAFKELGIDPKDPKMVKMVKALIESQKTDEQKAKEKQDEENAKIAELEQKAFIAEAKAEAMQLGVKPQFVDDVVSLVVAKSSEDTDLKTLIGEYKTKYPMWFGTDSEDDDTSKKQKKTGQKGTGSSIKSGKDDKPSKEEKSLGARLAAQRKTGAKKSSYWK